MAVVKKTKKMTLNQSNALASLAMENMALTDKEKEFFLSNSNNNQEIDSAVKKLVKLYKRQ